MLYTVGFLLITGETSIEYENTNSEPWKIVLLRKSYAPEHRLHWQNNLLNGIGGKLDPGELPDDCMKREFHEETGLIINNWELYCITEKAGGGNTGDEVYFYKASMENLPKLPECNDSGEKIELIDFKTISSRNDLIDNLHWLIPMAFREHQPILAEVIYKG